MFNNKDYQYTYLTGATTKQVFTGLGILAGISVNSTTATAFGIYDGIASTSQPVGILKASIVENTYIFNATISSGLYVTFGTSGNYTVIWSKG